MLTTFLVSLFFISKVSALVSYANEFVDPDYILAGNFSNKTWKAQVTIGNWAEDIATKGPWSVTTKSYVAPSGDKHDYMSWAPYSWPDCSSIGNTTELTPEDVWKTCPYITKDGQFNPDGRLVNNVGDFQDMSDAIFFNSLAWSFRGQSTSIFSQRIVTWIKTWFLDADTKMNPNLNYAQMKRGPDGQVGQHTGVLDLKNFAKIATAILILRKGKSSDWTTEIDTQFIAWCSEYITWLETAKIAIEEREATNNHGSFYFNQLAALKVIVNDLAGAKNVTQSYINGIYRGQIDANGEQPLEAARTRPYHYRAYNLAAMITNGRIEKYADAQSDIWNRTTAKGATPHNALDFAMTFSAADSNEASYAPELYPSIAAVAAIYGDPDNKYSEFLRNADVSYWQQPYFLWNQPLAGGVANSAAGDPTIATGSTSGGSSAGTNSGSTTKKSGSKNVGFAVQVSFVGLLATAGAGLGLLSA